MTSTSPVTAMRIFPAMIALALTLAGCAMRPAVERLPGPYGDPGTPRDLPPGKAIHRHAVLPALPVQPTIAGDATAMCVARGGGHVVHCWGANPSGRTGGSGAFDRRPNRIDGLPVQDGVVQLVVGSTATCGLLQSGHVLCWGGNQMGELGNYSRRDSRAPVYVQGISRAARLVGVDQTFCAISREGRVDCWGNPEPLDGINGDPPGTNAWSFGAPNHIRALRPPVRALALARNGGGCVVRGRGEASCWGETSWFEGKPRDKRLTRVPTTAPVVQVSLGALANPGTCFTLEDGVLACLGGSIPPTYAQGRLLPFENVPRPLPVPDTGTVAAFVVGISGHRCVLRQDGSVRCWGQAAGHVCAQPPGYVFPSADLRGYFKPPTQETVTECRRLCSGDLRNTPDASTRCELFCGFGLGHLDDLARSDRAGDVVSPSPVPALTDRFVSIGTQQSNVCGVDAEGEVTCWGTGLDEMPPDGRPRRLRGLD